MVVDHRWIFDRVVSWVAMGARNGIIDVVGAAIVNDGRILCAQRGEGRTLAGYWEFPGGKIEPHETARQALRREIGEELRCEVAVGRRLCTSEYDYDFGTVRLTTFVCRLTSGTPHRTEHAAFRWMPPAEISTLEWAPVDHDAVAMLAALDADGLAAALDDPIAEETR